MNIVRALDVALPELPQRLVRQNPPRLDPSVIWKEHIENGDPVIVAKKPGTDLVFRFQPIQWRLISMFDGKRTPAEVAQLFSDETGRSSASELAAPLQKSP
jgi:putative peptide zinc metalloprotease protein